MITETKILNDNDIKFLRSSWRGRRIFSYYRAYGTKYDFCRFFRANYKNGHGIIIIINATLEASFEGNVEIEEIAWFIISHLPFRVQLSDYVTEKIIKSDLFNTVLEGRYRVLRRTCFGLSKTETSKNFDEKQVEFNPSLDSVYKILSEGFPNLLEYSLWITDTSHRCRHGISHILNYRNATTATIMFDTDNHILVGEVATSVESRGLGYARDFLKWLAGFLNNFGKTAVLYALDIRRSFYREIGFKELGTENVLELRELEKDDISKGKLADV